MCSNFQAITPQQSSFVNEQFGCALPNVDWQEEVYPTYAAPFILLAAGQPQCHLAQFGLVPHWAVDKKRFGLKTYNARSETVAEKPSYRSAWRRRQFGLALMQSFYEPCYESGKAVRWRIRRTDASPMAVASIFEHVIDPATGTALWSFSLLTIHAAQHPVMQHFHKPEDEKRSIVVLPEDQYQAWLQADTRQAQQLLRLAPADFLVAEAAPRPSKKQDKG